ncbi:Sensor histidine kinase ComP [Polaribacter huanghezhanensis]|uniref:ATP-binding protein n=1 Tax=Polaribacter huanghezhanensis TaxID=1354726 RepID=UPI00264A4262|nr:sensor histidine kinase [Polaribacter huanghezhanensis]WKD85245.1 Sensor histidine kinase ComP [Polaribacter huanghezhanensis]
MIKNVILIIAVLFLLGCSEKLEQKQNDSISKKVDSLIQLSSNISFNDSIRTVFLSKADNQIDKIKNDSLKAHLLIRTTYGSLMLGDFKEYGRKSKQILKFSLDRKDTIALTRAYSYLGYFYQFEYKVDSAYYFYNKALHLFELREDKINEGRMLLSMATLQEDVKDFTGSEINAIKAISKLEGTDEFRSLYLAYNSLAINNKNLGKFNLSIQNFEKSKSYLSKIKNNQFLYATTYNNIGRVYAKQGNHIVALDSYNKALEIKNLNIRNPRLYAMALDNKAYSKFILEELSEIPALFYKSLQIRDSLQIKDGMVASYHHLAEYNLSKHDTLKALQYGLLSKNIAKEINYNDGLLESYKLLSKISQGTKGKQYLNKYIQLSDSLQQQERVVREKFTRIAYETDEVIQENKKTQEKNYLLMLILIITSVFFLLIYFIIRQRSKNKELEFAQKEDKSNIEIYNLMLSQQKMFNEGSVNEQNRISRDLHDGVLGRLFGTRLSLDAFNEGVSENDIKAREKNINELQSIEEEIREISHNLKLTEFNNNSSFKVLVEQLMEKQSKITSFNFQLNFDKNIDWENISNTIKINCYRILQEAIQNINKYSEAKKVIISFTKAENNLLFCIEDNGIGFNTKAKSKGIGLKNIRSRVNDLKGKVNINSVKDKGTKITIEISLRV